MARHLRLLDLCRLFFLFSYSLYSQLFLRTISFLVDLLLGPQYSGFPRLFSAPLLCKKIILHSRYTRVQVNKGRKSVNRPENGEWREDEAQKKETLSCQDKEDTLDFAQKSHTQFSFPRCRTKLKLPTTNPGISLKPISITLANTAILNKTFMLPTKIRKNPNTSWWISWQNGQNSGCFLVVFTVFSEKLVSQNYLFAFFSYFTSILIHTLHHRTSHTKL